MYVYIYKHEAYMILNRHLNRKYNSNDRKTRLKILLCTAIPQSPNLQEIQKFRQVRYDRFPDKINAAFLHPFGHNSLNSSNKDTG